MNKEKLIYWQRNKNILEKLKTFWLIKTELCPRCREVQNLTGKFRWEGFCRSFQNKDGFKTRSVCHRSHVAQSWKHPGIVLTRLLLENCFRTSPFSWWRATSLCPAAIFLPASCDLPFQLLSNVSPRPLTLHFKGESGSCCCINSLHVVGNGRERFAGSRRCWSVTNPVRKAFRLWSII